jgi:hypothetical protein
VNLCTRVLTLLTVGVFFSVKLICYLYFFASNLLLQWTGSIWMLLLVINLI